MKAIAVFPKEKAVRMIDHPSPRIEKPGEVMVKMLEVGVCGTDKEICAFQYGTPPPGSDYLVIGHESLGEVVEVGSGVSDLKPGDLVVLTVRRPCPHARCAACRAGRQDFCYTGDFTERGIKGRHGYMTEYVVDEAQFMVKADPDLRSVAALIEPLTIAEKALIQIWSMQERLPWACEIKPGRDKGYCHSALVLGAGPVGMLGACALVNSGFQTWVYSRAPAPNSRSEILDKVGAKYVSSTTHRVEDLVREIGNVDVVYEAVGASNVAFDAIRALGTNGIFAFTGVPGRKEPVELDGAGIMRNMVLRNQVIFGTVNAGRDSFEAAMRDLRAFQDRWPEATGRLITGRHKPEAFEDLLLGDKKGIKNVIEFC